MSVFGYNSTVCIKLKCFAEGPWQSERPINVINLGKNKVLLDFFQKIVGFQRVTLLVAFRRKRNPYALRAFLILFAIEKESEFEAEPHKLLRQFS